MTFELNASHHQHELEAEAEHARLVREARPAIAGLRRSAAPAPPSALASSNSASRSAAKPPDGGRRTRRGRGRSHGPRPTPR